MFSKYEFITLNAGIYTLTMKDGTKYIFNSTGILTDIIDRNGHSISLTYDASSKLIMAKENISGVKIYFSYDELGKLLNVSDDLNRQVLFTYDASNNLTSITDANGYKTTYQSNSQGQITQANDSEGRRLFSNTYDLSGRIVLQDDSLDTNLITRFSYDETTQPGKIITYVADRTGKTKKLIHDSNYRLLSSTDQLGFTGIYTYDSNGNRTQITDPQGGTQKITYDERGNMTTITNQLNKTSSFTYDSKNNLTSVTDATYKSRTYTYDENNNLLTEKDTLNNVMSYSYNTNSLLTSTTLPEGGTANFEYVNGRLSNTTDPTGVVNTYTL